MRHSHSVSSWTTVSSVMTITPGLSQYCSWPFSQKGNSKLFAHHVSPPACPQPCLRSPSPWLCFSGQKVLIYSSFMLFFGLGKGVTLRDWVLGWQSCWSGRGCWDLPVNFLLTPHPILAAFGFVSRKVCLIGQWPSPQPWDSFWE